MGRVVWWADKSMLKGPMTDTTRARYQGKDHKEVGHQKIIRRNWSGKREGVS